MVNYNEIGLTRINMKVILNATTTPHNSYRLNALSYWNIKQRFKIKDKEHQLMHWGLP
jgi:hypothetical protein